MNYKLRKISGDASFREFYRIKKNNKTSIIVFARKEQYKNLIVYSVVNKILNSHNILSPKLLKNYYKDNMIEITDLGDKSFYDYIKNKKDKFKDYKKLIELIISPLLSNIKAWKMIGVNTTIGIKFITFVYNVEPWKFINPDIGINLIKKVRNPHKNIKYQTFIF